MEKLNLTAGISNVPSGMDFTDIYTMFPDSFMQDYTKCKNIMDFCAAIGYDISSKPPETKTIASGAYDTLIRQYSDFESWTSMWETAIQYHEDLGKCNKGDK